MVPSRVLSRGTAALRGTGMDQKSQALGGDAAMHLQDALLASGDVEGFLHALAGYAASAFSRPERAVHCGVHISSRRKASASAASSSQALDLEHIQNSTGDGPQLAAVGDSTIVHIRDMEREERWPLYVKTAVTGGFRSVLVVPLALGDMARGTLTFYAPVSSAFGSDDVASFQLFAGEASKSLRLALTIARCQDARRDLLAALESRTVIGLAAGVIMAQNRCSQDDAFRILREASNARHIKLRDVAASVIAPMAAGTEVRVHFDE